MGKQRDADSISPTTRAPPALVDQACPNYARCRWPRPAARPPDLRKGSAFPTDAKRKQLPPLWLGGSASQPERRRTKGAGLAGKPQAFRKSARRSRRGRRPVQAFWTRLIVNWPARTSKAGVRAPTREII